MAENRELALVLKLVADQFQAELRKSGGLLGDFKKLIGDWRTQLTAAGGALFAIAQSTANYGDELVKMSQRLGMGVEDTARLQHAAKLSDTDLQGLTSTVGFLSKSMLEFSQGNAEAQQTFYRLGISATDANGRLKDTKDILLEISDKFRLMPDGPEKTALAMKALGKTGKDVLPFLNSDLRGAFEEAEKLGLVMSEADAKAAEHFNDEITKLQGAIRGVTNDVGTLMIPKFDALAHALTTIITDAREAAKALAGITADQPKVGVIKPEGGGRNIRIVPPPAGIENAQVDRVIPTEADLKKLQEDYRLYIAGLTSMGEEFLRKQREGYQLYITGVTAMGQEKLDKEKASYQLYLQGLTSMGEEKLQKDRESYQLYITGITAMGEEKLKKEREGYQLYLQGITAMGQEKLDKDRQNLQLYIQGLVSMGEQAKALRLREQQGLIDNQQAWIEHEESLGRMNEDTLRFRLDLVRANLAKELDLNIDTAGRLLIAWQTNDKELSQSILATTNKTAQEQETIMLRTTTAYRRAILENSNDFISGWAEGMRRYVNDTKSGFGMSADMARRTFQTMEQSAQTFFFDAMEGRITRLKDVFTSFLNFAKQVSSQILSQLIVRQLGGAFAGLSPSLFGSSGGGWDLAGQMHAATGGQVVKRFAYGGPVSGSGNQDSVPALLTPGEYVLSRRDVSDIKSGLGMTVIVQNYGNNEVKTSTGTGPDGKQALYVVVRDMVKGMAGSGELDSPFGMRYGMTPKPFGR